LKERPRRPITSGDIVFDKRSAREPGAGDTVKQILVVDDEPATLRVITLALSNLHYDVLSAGTPHDALAIVQDGSVDLVITDYRMPGMTGRELIEALQRCRPSLKTIIVTGYADNVDVTDPQWWKAQTTLLKPFSLQRLKETVQNAIGTP
jgi:two-component system NtrC family response regulator